MKTSKFILPVVLMLASCGGDEEYAAEGTFEATEITVSAETAGKIVWFDIEEGDVVEKGQQVAQIDTVQLALQRAQLHCGQTATLASRPDVAAQQASLRQQIENAVTERDRVARLLVDGAATQKQLDNANQQIATLERTLDGLTSQLKTQTNALNKQVETTEAQIAQISENISRCKILSPVAGTVLTKFAEAGEIAAPGKPLYKIADMNKVYLRAYFTSSQLADVKVGQKVTVIANYGGDKTQEYEGVVQWIASQSEFTPKTIQTNDSRANLVYAEKLGVKNDGNLKIGLQGRVKK